MSLVIDWECSHGPYHIFDPEEFSVCVEGCRRVHFHCANCLGVLDTRKLEDCPKETQMIVAEILATEWEEAA